MTAFYLTALCVFGLDRLLKATLSGREMQLVPGLLRITTVHNTGTAMGLMDRSPALLLILLSAGLMLLLPLIARRHTSSWLSGMSLGAIFGGAAGNLWDRLFLGYVIDLFDFEFVRFYVFNFADAAIVVGCVLCALTLLWGEERYWKGKDGGKDPHQNG